MEWLKNDEQLRLDSPRKYQIIGNGTALKIKNIAFADTGAYMCQATSIGKRCNNRHEVLGKILLTRRKTGSTDEVGLNQYFFTDFKYISTYQLFSLSKFSLTLIIEIGETSRTITSKST